MSFLGFVMNYALTLTVIFYFFCRSICLVHFVLRGHLHDWSDLIDGVFYAVCVSVFTIISSFVYQVERGLVLSIKYRPFPHFMSLRCRPLNNLAIRDLLNHFIHWAYLRVTFVG